MQLSTSTFHNTTKELTPIPEDFDTWPISWKKTYYKEYKRAPLIYLDRSVMKSDLFSLLEERFSARSYRDSPLNLSEIGTLLGYGCGNIKAYQTDLGQRWRRGVPSAGARFPTETYLVVLKGNDDVGAGLYHYRIREHALEVLYSETGVEIALEDFSHKAISVSDQKWVSKAPAILLFTSVFARMEEKYGPRAYRFSMLDVGYIAHNVSLVGQAIGLATCSLGGLIDVEVERMLEIDGINESFIHAVVLGKSS